MPISMKLGYVGSPCLLTMVDMLSSDRRTSRSRSTGLRNITSITELVSLGS